MVHNRGLPVLLQFKILNKNMIQIVMYRKHLSNEQKKHTFLDQMIFKQTQHDARCTQTIGQDDSSYGCQFLPFISLKTSLEHQDLMEEEGEKTF